MKKINISMNQKDKRLLVLLLAVIIAFISYLYIIDPQLTKASELRAQAGMLERDLERTEQMIADLPQLKKEEREKKESLLEKFQPFFYELNEERILKQLSRFMTESGLPIDGYTPTAPVASSIVVPMESYLPLQFPLLTSAAATNPQLIGEEGNAADQNSQPAATTDAPASDAIPTTDIDISLKDAGYPAIMNFIKKVEGMEKTILIKNIELEKGETGINGNIIISVYSMPKLDQSEMDDYQFSPSVGKGKPDPFQ